MPILGSASSCSQRQGDTESRRFLSPSPSDIHPRIDAVEDIVEDLHRSTTIREPMTCDEYDMKRVAGKRGSEMYRCSVVPCRRREMLERSNEFSESTALMSGNSAASPFIDIGLLNVGIE